MLGLAAVPAGYGVAGLIGGVIPAHPGWRQASDGVTIYVVSNGIHTDLLLPATAGPIDWRALVRPRDIADPRFANRRWLAFGWGDRDFYLNTPSWDRIDPARVLRAATGSGSTVLHVEYRTEPARAGDVYRIVLRPEEYRRLAGFVRATFAGGAARHGYGRHDAFYPARGGYSAIRTCNAWTGEALRHAGVRVGRWTPFPVSVTALLPAP